MENGRNVQTHFVRYESDGSRPQLDQSLSSTSTRSDVPIDVIQHQTNLISADASIQRQTHGGRDQTPRTVPLGLGKKDTSSMREELLGKEPPIPRYFLSYAAYKNSFFAKRLLRLAFWLALVMVAGVLVYYTVQVEGVGLRKDGLDGFVLDNPSDVYTFRASACANMIGFSALVYHSIPLVILLALPASGLRALEPFKRTQLVDPTGNRHKIKRTLFFQACEVFAAITCTYLVLIAVFFFYMFFNGGAFHCDNASVFIFAIVAVLCYFSVFAELVLFARFREHVKMQLGAFQEGDQTGDVRHHVMDRGVDPLLSKGDVLRQTIRKKLYSATRLGDLREMQKALDLAHTSGLDTRGFPSTWYAEPKLYFGIVGASKKNPMHVAAYQGNIEAMELLLSRGFRVDALDKFSRMRFSTGDLFWSFANCFVSRPGDDDEDMAGASTFKTTLVSPLHCAVATGQLKAAEWLLDHGAEVDPRARSNKRNERVPPLFMAEHPEVVRLLLHRGAKHLVIPDPGHENTLSALQLAYLRGNYAVARELEEWGGDVALTPFHAASADNDVSGVRKFLRRKTNVNCLGEHGYVGMNRRTPLHWGVIGGAFESVELLLEAGADVDFQDMRGRTPVHWAARLNRADILQVLISKGGRVDLPDADKMTPVVCAAYCSDASDKLLSLLVQAGADVNYQMPQTGDTALHIAVRNENEGAAKAVLACGGDLMRMNQEGERPLDCTSNTRLLFEVKKAAGQRDVMISYTHSHAEFACKLRRSLENANVTTWLDLMDPSGIGGGAVWREEIARGVSSAAVVLCILTEDYTKSDWCLKELALAKQVGTPILAVSTEHARLNEDLQVYLYTRQIIPFESAITNVLKEGRKVEYEYDGDAYQSQFRLLLDGVRDEVEKSRSTKRRGKMHKGSSTSIPQVKGFAKLFHSFSVGEDGNNKSFVFLSHGDYHVDFVSQVYDELRQNNVLCFGDRSRTGEESFEDRIRAAKEAITHCSAFLVLISKNTQGSELVRDQLAFAEDKGKPIFPLVLNDMEIGLDKSYTLARSELYHFLRGGAGFASSFNKLMTDLKRVAGPSVNHVEVPVAVSTEEERREDNDSTFVSFLVSNADDKIDEQTEAEIGEDGKVYCTIKEEDGPTERRSTRNLESLVHYQNEDGSFQLDMTDTHVRM